MIILHHPKDSKEAPQWKNLLEELTVAHLLVVTDSPSPYLSEGKKKITGKEAIDTFLQEYKVFMKGWNQDRCDMWFFDEA